MRELLATIGSDELGEWIAYNNLDPITQDRGDAQAALICQTLANVNRGKGQPAFRVEQFMPKYGRKHEKPSLRSQFQLLCAAKGIPQKGR